MTMKKPLGPFIGTVATSVVMIGTWCLFAEPARAAGQSDPKHPKLTLSAAPAVGTGPTRVTLTAALVGGANDDKDFYCLTIEWNWGDGTRSEAAADCRPYEPGKTTITRRFAVEHVFQEGDYRVRLSLKQRGRELASADANVEIR
jgi:hypothetical protein